MRSLVGFVFPLLNQSLQRFNPSQLQLYFGILDGQMCSHGIDILLVSRLLQIARSKPITCGKTCAGNKHNCDCRCNGFGAGRFISNLTAWSLIVCKILTCHLYLHTHAELTAQDIRFHYMRSGADTPSIARPLYITCLTARISTTRAALSAASSLTTLFLW